MIVSLSPAVRMKAKRWDILGIGCATLDDLVYVREFQGPDVKTRAVRAEQQFGGLTATALVTAARLGASCAFAGVLGEDPLSQAVEADLTAEGVDCSPAPRDSGARPIRSTVIVDLSTGGRTIFFVVDGAVGALDDQPSAAVLEATKILFLDGYGMSGAIRAARIAREAGIPIVVDFERAEDPRFPELLALVDHLVVSRSFAYLQTGASEPAEAVRRLWNSGRDTVVVTAGEQGAWFLTAGDNEVRHESAPVVPVVDTTGCGDVFHGAYAAALARGEGATGRVRFASAAAALKATRYGGRAGIPTLTAVEELLLANNKARANQDAES
jgi:sulfofructose kinase